MIGPAACKSWRCSAAIVSLLLGLAWPQGSTAEVLSGVVTHVTDGDTVWIAAEGLFAHPVKLRLLGIDAPERCQAWGTQATAALAGHVLHQSVSIDTEGKRDVYGRLLGRLQRGDEDIGAWMVRRGHAWNDRYRQFQGPYADEEAQARSRSSGLFADLAAEPPRRFRKRHGPCE